MARTIPEGLPQIGPATLALLRSRGIQTNLDVLYARFPRKKRAFSANEDRDALSRVPGIGYGREAILREWALSVPLSHDEQRQIAEARSGKRQSCRKDPFPKPTVL
jgi:hypothetical protein